MNYTQNMKMSELVESNFHLLSVFARVGINRSFGEKTVAEACAQAALDTDTFLLLCQVYSTPDYRPTPQQLRDCHINDILKYLHKSHDYYLNNLVGMADALERLIAPCSERQKEVIRHFYSDYKLELERHFDYEEQQVIPYIQRLVLGLGDGGFIMNKFEENHSQIRESLADLTNLVLKSLPAECDNDLRTDFLISLYHLQQDLDSHTSIEDDIMVPMVKLIENPRVTPAAEGRDIASEEDSRSALSEREKEILVSVAEGLSNKEIADRHNISVNTVISHRKNITKKTGIRTVAGLTVYAILNNLIEIGDVDL